MFSSIIQSLSPTTSSRQAWQDRLIEFDSPTSFMEETVGEQLVMTVPHMMDGKGNMGTLGTLKITHLRLTWISDQNPLINISIGLMLVLNVACQHHTIQDQLIPCLSVSSRTKESTFEFMFYSTATQPSIETLVSCLSTTLELYNVSKIYRQVYLKRKNVILDHTIHLLPQESIHEKIEGVSNVAADQGNLGIFYITNIRLVWHSILNTGFNISIPYLQEAIKLQNSKYGLALAIHTHPQYADAMKIGFKLDTEEKTKLVAKTVKLLCKVYFESPVYGVGLIPLTNKDFVVAPDRKQALPPPPLPASTSEPPFDALGQETLVPPLVIEYNDQLGLAVKKGTHMDIWLGCF